MANNNEKKLNGTVIVTYRCNARCSMCNRYKAPSKPEEEISIETIKKLPKMYFTNITGGEPFIRTDLKDIVRELYKKSDRIVISTNGFFTDRIVDLCKEFPQIGIRISIEGLEQTNNEIRGLQNGYQRGYGTLKKLREMGMKDVGFGMTVQDKNAPDLVPLYKISDEMGMEFATASLHNSFYFVEAKNIIHDRPMVAKNLLINLITLILFSQGLGVYGYNESSDNYYYFLGLRIAFTPFILTELLLSHIVDYLQEKKLSSFTRMSFAVGLLTLFIEKIATGLLAIVIIYALMFLVRRKNIKLNMYAIYLIYAIGFILIVVYNIQYKLPFFSYLLEDVMHKDLSFDNRTTIWASTIAAFLKQPLFGYGVTGGGGVLVEFKYRVATLSAHNQILNTLYEGGIVSFVFFVIMFGVVAEKIKKCFSLKLNRLYSCFLIGYLMIMFTEVQTTKALLFITLSIITNTDKLIEEN